MKWLHRGLKLKSIPEDGFGDLENFYIENHLEKMIRMEVQLLAVASQEVETDN